MHRPNSGRSLWGLSPLAPFTLYSWPLSSLTLCRAPRSPQPLSRGMRQLHNFIADFFPFFILFSKHCLGTKLICEICVGHKDNFTVNINEPFVQLNKYYHYIWSFFQIPSFESTIIITFVSISMTFGWIFLPCMFGSLNNILFAIDYFESWSLSFPSVLILYDFRLIITECYISYISFKIKAFTQF